MLAVAEQFLAQNIHPTVIIREYRQALEDAVKLLQDKISIPIDLNDREKLKEVVCTFFKIVWFFMKLRTLFTIFFLFSHVLYFY